LDPFRRGQHRDGFVFDETELKECVADLLGIADGAREWLNIVRVDPDDNGGARHILRAILRRPSPTDNRDGSRARCSAAHTVRSLVMRLTRSEVCSGCGLEAA
jgi:hypothetical protein